ncbi:MAG: nucleoside kinase [Lachnospiraceae bacterium]|jgi:uridine kinase|nr:nucleoside kinase [Lachnospiraceae bacterium]MCI8873889.1 nucleoside kinase [Lachnospiraceae bacterium]GFI30247.1 threonine--tRNA ligase 1 [Lachnospiraceae bacterium]
MEETVYCIQINGEKKNYLKGTSYQEIAEEYQSRYKDDILLVLFNNRLRELRKTVKGDGTLVFVTARDKAGRKAYRRSVTFLMQRAVHNLAKDDGKQVTVKVAHSISQGYYCQLKGDIPDREYLARLKAEMMRMAEENIPIQKKSISTDDAVELFRNAGMHDKERLFSYRRSSKVNIYSIGHYIDYFYGYMAPSTGYLKYFELLPYEDGFVVMFPHKNTRVPAEFSPSHKLFHVLRESAEWGEKMEIGTIGALNDAVAQGRIRDVILVAEALMERKIGTLAEQVASLPDKKFIMIAGPSSSGKTTFSHRLSIQMMAQGLKPHPIALDDYYVNRVDTPKDENGNYNFECLEALDIELFNHDMSALLAGERVELPTYNFRTGKREYKGIVKQLGKNDILVLEGIHGLNGKLSYSLPESSKLKIYISPLTQLSIDEHNNLPTADGRMIRRMVRDARTRNISAKETIAMWDSVRRGEEQYIFPFQEEADIMFNSALIYELAVLKQYAEPLLFQIDKNSPEYTEAKRLLKFLDYFLPVPSEDIEKNSILREFIGGSCFNV